MSKIYLVGSLRNERIPEISELLREDGHDVFDDWFASGPRADDHWREYEMGRGRTYMEAINGKAAQNVCNFDKTNILACDTNILILPAGISGQRESGFAYGAGKQTHILLDKDYNRWDVMLALSHGVWDDLDELRNHLSAMDAFDVVRKEDSTILAHPLMDDKPSAETIEWLTKPRTSQEHREEMLKTKYGVMTASEFAAVDATMEALGEWTP